YLVVVVDQLAAQHARPQLARLGVKRQEYRVKILSRVAQVSLGGLADRSSIAGLLLREAVDLEHLPRQLAGRLHAFKVGEPGRRRQARNTERADLGSQLRRGKAGAFLPGKQGRGRQHAQGESPAKVLKK